MPGLADVDGEAALKNRVRGSHGRSGLFDNDVAHPACHLAVDENCRATLQYRTISVIAAGASRRTGVLVNHCAPGGESANEDIRAAWSRREGRATVRGGITDSRCWRHLSSSNLKQWACLKQKSLFESAAWQDADNSQNLPAALLNCQKRAVF